MRATRPDRQTLLFSATLPHKVKHLVREALSDEVSVAVGNTGAAHADVQQDILLMPSSDAKMQWLQARTPRLVDEGQVLVFVNSRAVVDGLVALLEVCGCPSSACGHSPRWCFSGNCPWLKTVHRILTLAAFLKLTAAACPACLENVGGSNAAVSMHGSYRARK